MSTNLFSGIPKSRFEPFLTDAEPRIYEAEIPGAELALELNRAGNIRKAKDLTSLPDQQVAVALPAEALRAVVTAAGSVTPASGVNYCLRNAKSGLYLTVDGANTENGANCSQRGFTGENSQVWYLHQGTNGYYEMVPRHAPSRRLSVISGANTEGANIGLTGGLSTPSASQEWTLTKSARNNYVLASRVSNGARVLGVDPNNSTAEGGNVALYTYTNDTLLNDEWVFEPFVAPFMEYDQGYFMYHSDYSSLAIQQRLKAFSDQVESILYSEFGLRCRPSTRTMIPSLADECTSMLYNCEHGSNSGCTNSYNSEEDHIHHKNWSKNFYWYMNRGRQPNGLHILWQGHPKCIQLTTSTGAKQHTFFQMAQRYYYQSAAGSPFMLMNLPLNVSEKQMVAILLAGISAIFGANTASHDVNCVADSNCNTQTIYDRVLGANPTLSSFWCNDCKQLILNNIDRFSKSAP